MAIRGESLNIRSWFAAMCWRMMPDLSNSSYVERLICVWRYSGLEWSDFLPPPTPAPEFRDAIRVSGHTCWVESQMDDYAAAMAFLEEDPKVVGIDVRKNSGCQVCRLQWRLRSLSENLPVEERAFEADLTELEDMLRTERSRRMVARGGILASVQHHNATGHMSNSDHQEKQDPHYTLYDRRLAGVPVRDLKKIYKAIHTDTAKLELRHIPGARRPGQAVSQQEFFVVGRRNNSCSRIFGMMESWRRGRTD
ncbi:hypothetical protein C8J56DRAFT_1085143 [Mycena floridula]|nr:hypothetical protein C8J56DRAFT_1085143 [Mycena floridula]